MKKISFIYTVLLSMMFYSCQTYTVVPIDYLVPADVSFPTQIKKVGIVNNTNKAPGRIPENAALDSALIKSSNGHFENYILNGDPKVATESLAEYVAAENYFDEVIICDSALQARDVPKTTPFISKEDINKLTRNLDVDMLISLEELQIHVKRQVFPMGSMGYLGTVDAKVFPRVNLYIPNRNSPLVMINSNDSIFWEDFETTVTYARTKVVPDEVLVAEASDFAGSIPVKHMTPHWKTSSRFFYNNGSPEMRDAAVFVQANDWDKAFEIWQKYFEKAKGIKKAHAASNISLYYEIKDDLEKAHEWGSKALELAKIANKIPDEMSEINGYNDYGRIRQNQNILEERRINFVTLKMQMNRFNDDFQSDSLD